METDPETEGRVYARTHPKHWINVTAEDIPPGWIDDMVKRLFDELNRQILRVEHASAAIPDQKRPDGSFAHDENMREQHARTLKSLQTSLERLMKLDTARTSQRKTARRTEKPGEHRARLAKKLNLQLESGAAGDLPAESGR